MVDTTDFGRNGTASEFLKRRRQIKEDVAFGYLSKFLTEDELAALRLGADIRLVLERPVEAGVMLGYVATCTPGPTGDDAEVDHMRKFIEIDTWESPEDFIKFKDRIFACMSYIKVHASPERAFY